MRTAVLFIGDIDVASLARLAVGGEQKAAKQRVPVSGAAERVTASVIAADQSPP